MARPEKSKKSIRTRSAATTSAGFETKDDVANAEAQPPLGETEQERRARISARAYELYRQCGCREGHELDHWLEAEREEAGTEAVKRPS